MKRLIIVVALLCLLRLCLTPLVAYFTRKGLQQLEGYDSDFSSLSLSVLCFSYTLENVVIKESPLRENAEPVLKIGKLSGKLLWQDLIKGKIAADLSIENASGVWTLSQPIDQEIQEKITWLKRYVPIENLDELDDYFRSVNPFKMRRVEVKGAKFVVHEKSGKKPFTLHLNNLELTTENFVNRHALNNGLPAIIAAKIHLQKEAEVNLFLTMDPVAEHSKMAAQMDLQNLDLTEFNSLLAEHLKLNVTQGTLDFFAKLSIANGKINAALKPVVKKAEIVSSENKLGSNIKAATFDFILDTLENDENQTVSTVIPLSGDADKPEVQIIPTIFGALRNAFVVALASGYQKVPPKVSKDSDSILRQFMDTFSKNKGGPKAEAPFQWQGTQGIVVASVSDALSPFTLRHLQTELKKQLYNVEINGKFDTATSNALLKFQTAKKFPQTGFPDLMTLKCLNTPPKLFWRPAN